MKLVAAKCPNCGANIDVDENSDSTVCDYCRTKIIVSDAIKKYQIDISGSKIKIDTSSEVENLLIRAKEFEQNNDFEKAKEYYNKVLDIDAKNEIAREWFQLSTYVYIGEKKIERTEYEKIKKTIESGNTIEAIRMVRDITNLGLREAKIWVDNYKSYNVSFPHDIGTNRTTGGCYIATCVYGSYDCPEVWTLRRYRDNKLDKTLHGRIFIKLYYAISPKIVKVFGKTNWFKNICKLKLDKMIVKLQTKGYTATPYIDKY